MIYNKMTIEGIIVSIGDWSETKKGDLIREIQVDAEAKRIQHYSLTQYCKRGEQAEPIQVGEAYQFKGFVNGICFRTPEGERYENKICITQLWKQL